MTTGTVSTTPTAYWWSHKPNLGDRLTAILLRHFANLDLAWAAPAQADLVVCGSVLDVLPPGWDGVVAGAGKLHADYSPDLREAKVLGLRGQLTLRDARLSSGNVVIGDPGLLVGELTPVERDVHEVGIVPHWSDTVLYPRFAGAFENHPHIQPVFVDITGPPLEVIRQIASCKKIVASALHGVIVADAFGIPRRVEPFPNMKTPAEGGSAFKFLDYASAIGQPIEWGKLGGQIAPRDSIERITAELFDMFRAVPAALARHV